MSIEEYYLLYDRPHLWIELIKVRHERIQKQDNADLIIKEVSIMEALKFGEGK